MNVIETSLADLAVVRSTSNQDARGAFTRLYCANELEPLLGHRQIVQINQSSTNYAGTVRGMHFQRTPHSEVKMVRCLRGKVWDVAVDLRQGSPTFLRWHAQELEHNDTQMLVIPEGFAHGFQALEDDTELLYLHTSFYDPSAEGGVRHDDPLLQIEWPLPVRNLSDRDLAHPFLESGFRGY